MKAKHITLLFVCTTSLILNFAFLSGCGQANGAPNPPAAVKVDGVNLPPGLKVGVKVWRAEALRHPAKILELHDQWALIGDQDERHLWLNVENGTIIQISED